jgi:ankyrin repeat protein
LIERGADVNQVDDEGSTPIMLAGRSKEIDELRFLLERNALLKVEVKDKPIKVKPILMEIIEGEFTDDSPTGVAALACVKAVIEAKRPKFDLNERHEEGDKFCPLIVAARDNKIEIVRYLLSCKYIKIDKIDKNGKTALHHACERRLLEVVTLLLDKGADPTINDAKNFTPIMICANVIVTGPNAISAEENNLNLAIAEYVLNEQKKRSPRKLNIGETDHGRTALHLACSNGLFFMVQKLVPAEADVDCTDHTLKTPLMYCAIADSFLKDRTLKIAEFFMANHCNIEQATAGKKTVIHFAAKNGRKDLLIKLVAKGVNVDVVDKRGMTPLMFAVETNSAENYDAAKYLVEVAGADLFAKDKVRLCIIIIIIIRYILYCYCLSNIFLIMLFLLYVEKPICVPSCCLCWQRFLY